MDRRFLETEKEKLKDHERYFVQVLSETQDRLKSTRKILILGYFAILFMIFMGVFNWWQDSFFWTIIHGGLGLLNLWTTNRLHNTRRYYRKLELETLVALAMINKMKKEYS